jgi:hypothetical protein
VRRIAERLPERYHATVAAGDHTLNADAGDFVAVVGTVDRPGVVSVLASTGCRPVGRPPRPDPTGAPPAGSSADAARASVDATLTALGVTGVRWYRHALPCGLVTVEAVGTGTRRLTATLHPAARPLLLTDAAYADPTGLAVRVDGTQVTITASTGDCRA